MYKWLFRDINVVKLETLAMLFNDPLKLNNVINTCLINQTLFYSVPFH